MRGLLLMLGLTCGAGNAFAGGPLWVVPNGSGVTPAKWKSPVQVYTDVGAVSLGCDRNPETYECIPDSSGSTSYPLITQQQGETLVKQTLAQWTDVPTSSFSAQWAGRLAEDITGANMAKVIGAWNGGGIQVIYDADGSVISEFTGGGGYGVLGIASPEYLAADGTTIVEGWVIVGGSWLETRNAAAISGVVTHEFGHAINLAHSQTNGHYALANPKRTWDGLPGFEQAGPDQCGPTQTPYPSADQIETMYPLINPYEGSYGYNSPQMATVNVADDMAALSALYPETAYASTTGTIRGRVVAPDGESPLTGINVIARRVDSPLVGAISRISGDLTQGKLGPDGTFVMTGLVPGASYVLHIDELMIGAYSTPKALLVGSEEYWNAGESGDSTADKACDSTVITLAAGEVRQLQVALNATPRAPFFTYIPNVLATSISDNGQVIAGKNGVENTDFWVWDKKATTQLGGYGFNVAISGNGRVVAASVGKAVDTPDGPQILEQPALWTTGTGWKVIDPKVAGCAPDIASIFDLSLDGSTAVGNLWAGCFASDVYAATWTAKTGYVRLPKVREGKTCPWDEAESCEGDSRANAVSSDGRTVAGFESFPELGARVGVLWRGNEIEVMRDPYGANWFDGYAGEILGMNSAGTIAVGGQVGPEANEAYAWTATGGTRGLGRLPDTFCYLDFVTNEKVCQDVQRETVANSVSDDGKVIIGSSFGEAAIYTPQMKWMLLSEFLEKQGVLETSRWYLLGGVVSASGKTIAGTALPLAGQYYQGFRVDLDQVFVCAGKGRGAQTLRVSFPDAMDQQLARGATVGFCPGETPL
jgi:uncharacterized membrane protein